MSQTNYSWTDPVGVTFILVECWGAGGGGGIGTSPDAGGGGGGAAYVRSRIAVIPGNIYNVAVADGTPYAQNGDNSNFNSEQAKAVGGGAGLFAGGGLGGQAVDCVGDVPFSGGDAANNVGYAGGGGGSSAGSSGPGSPGILLVGGAAPYRGGAGGGSTTASPTTFFNGDPGDGPGGGGGAGVGSVSGEGAGLGGTGAEGAVVIWNDTDGTGWPKFGAPIDSFGSPPPNPVNVKTRKSVSVM